MISISETFEGWIIYLSSLHLNINVLIKWETYLNLIAIYKKEMSPSINLYYKQSNKEIKTFQKQNKIKKTEYKKISISIKYQIENSSS